MRKILMSLIILISTILYITILINDYVVLSTKNRVVSIEESKTINDIDCIIVLGAGIRKDGPSLLLEDRLIRGIELYNENISPKIIMSGDHGKRTYDEVNIMKDYAIKKGVPSKDIFMDHAGFSTYDSMYRAKKIFNAKKVIIVTQEYHLPRALFIARKLGLDAYGVASEGNNYSGQKYRDMREFLARNKDFVKTIFKPKSKYLGEEIPLTGNGDITNDK